jgi:hypothetical protein
MARIDKAALKARMMALEEEDLAAAREHYEAYLSGTHLPEAEVHDPEDMAQARIAIDLADAFDEPIHGHEAKLAALRALDFGPKTVAEPGAVVGFGGRRFVVAVATRRFEVEGETYMGISPDSPIYRVIDGLSQGETFRHQGREMVLELVA